MECPDLNEAIARQRRTLAERTEVLGPEHERTLRTRFGLAELLGRPAEDVAAETADTARRVYGFS